MSGPVPAWFTETLSALMQRQHLDKPRMTQVLRGLLRGECGEFETGVLLVALHTKGETEEELAAAALVLREHAERFDTGSLEVLDTCGTGGDGLCTFNVSTATALVVAGCGVPVVKHGNRAVTSRSGSADVLSALGVSVQADPARARLCLEQTGMAFCLAPLYHPALRAVGAVRQRLGVRTLFNCLGPLANPACAPYQLLGVGQPEWLDRMAGALARLGTRRAFLVCGADGLDEVSLSGPTRVREVCGDRVRGLEWTPEDFGLARCTAEELCVEGPEASAAVIRAVLAGQDGPALRIVLANAAAALLAAGRVERLPDGVAWAREAIASGRAARVLRGLAELSQGSGIRSQESGTPCLLTPDP
jgi:anthranilate phosphoribosyltransferase